MKGVEPIICKRIRRIFKNAGYESFLIRKSNKPKDIMKNKNILVKWSSASSRR